MKQDMLAPWAELVGEAGVMSADDLLALRDDRWRYELVEGRLIRMPPTGLEHRDIWVRLFRAMDRFVEAGDLGIVTPSDTGFRLTQTGAPDTVLSPDLAFITRERVQLLPAPGTPERKKYLPIAPDLAVEIASPDQYHPEMAEKAQVYLSAGTRLVWIIWPSQRQADIWRPHGEEPVATLDINAHLDGLDVLPGFTYSILHLFA